MFTLPEIVELLQDRRPSIVADACNVRVGTIIDIREGRTQNPSYETIKKLSEYFQAQGSA